MSEIKLPECHLFNDGTNDYNLGEFGLPTMLSSDDKGMKIISLSNIFDTPSWARFMMHLRQVIAKDRRVFFVDGVARMASINWLRDHVHEMKGYKHWEYDIKSYLDFMIENQSDEGYFYEITVIETNGHSQICPSTTKFINDHLALVRIEIEADVEYLVVEGAYTVYKATGDEEWIKKVLPRLEKSIDYMTSAPKRWDAEHGLCKRAFTMDTWDFAYGADSAKNREIHEDTPMSIMHGDNSGVYQAMTQLAWINRRLGNEAKASEWDERAAKLRENLIKYCWNGNFFTHQVHLGHDGAEGADETKILSLSNSYDMNRGVTTLEQNDKIISEYKRRKDTFPAFAEWYCINPPYEHFKDAYGNDRPKNYVNGGISTMTAGELAKAAFTNGHEAYGWDIIKRIRDLTAKVGSMYFLYDPETGNDISGGPTGWSAGAVMDAIDAGLAGIVDEGVCFSDLKFSPRWAITEHNEIRYTTGYEVSKTMVQSNYWYDGEKMTYELRCPSKHVDCHILLPVGKKCDKVLLDGEEVAFENSKVLDSEYVDFAFDKEPIPVLRNEWIPLKSQVIELVLSDK